MNAREDMARRAAGLLVEQGDAAEAIAFDPLMILALLSVVVEVLKMLGWLRLSEAQSLARLKRPGPVERFFLRRAVTKAARKHFAGRKDLNRLQDSMAAALTKSAAGLTPEGYKALVS